MEFSNEKEQKRTRLDQWVLKNGHTHSKTRAQQLIKTHGILVNKKLRTKPGFFIYENDEIELVQSDHHYVSRGAFKLIKALNTFNINPKGKVCMDVGSSTGGFTQVLIERSAEKVYAIDVGQNQLRPEVASNPKVEPLENTNILDVIPEQIEKVDLVVIDVSFVSLSKILEHVCNFLTTQGEVIALIKPQFEVGKEAIGKNGIVTNVRAHDFAVDKVKKAATSFNYTIKGNILESPIKGGDGNKEFLIRLVK